MRPAALVLALAAAAAPLAALETTDVVHREFTLVRGARAVAIDNVFGPVHVRAGAGDRVTVEIHRTARAGDAAGLEQAQREVTLAVEERPGRLELVQDGPFRDDERGGGHRARHQPGYEIEWRWEVTVPADAALEAATVNGGELSVEGVRGAVLASNVNGDVRLAGLGGRASASTVNGDLHARVRRRARGSGRIRDRQRRGRARLPGRFRSRARFLDPARRRLHRLPLRRDRRRRALRARCGGRRGGWRHTWRLGREAVVRLGAGGPRLTCSTVNGDIAIRER